MQIIEAGQIGVVEWILISIGVLWLAGALSRTIYIPVVIKEPKNEEEKDETKISEEIKISKPKKSNQQNDYTDFEEIKE